MAAIIARTLSQGETGVQDIGGTQAHNQYPGQPFQPLCDSKNASGAAKFTLLPGKSVMMTSKTTVECYEKAKQACIDAGLQLASLHGLHDYAMATDVCTSFSPKIAAFRSFYPSGLVIGHLAIATLWAHYWVAIKCRRVLKGDTRLSRFDQFLLRTAILTANDASGKTVVPLQVRPIPIAARKL